MRRAARVDTTQREIAAALRACGASVQSLATVGGGCPDLLVGWRRDNYLIEVKSDKRVHHRKEALRESQQRWIREWQGAPVHVVDSVEAALGALGIKT